MTNKGAEKVNETALAIKGVTKAMLKTGFRGDPKVNAGSIYVKHGLQVRLTRNLDKDRGFVNGAVGTIEDVLSDRVFTVRLSSGVMVLVHPIHSGSSTFLPCTYGYATTIRRAQGSSLQQGALYFDHCYPAERGYGYVGASRFRSSEGLWLFGKIRRTDWLPVNWGETTDEQEKRSTLSQSSESELERDSEDYDEPDYEEPEYEDDYYASDSDKELDELDEDIKNYEEPDDDREDIDWHKLLRTDTQTDLPASDEDLSSEEEEEVQAGGAHAALLHAMETGGNADLPD